MQLANKTSAPPPETAALRVELGKLLGSFEASEEINKKIVL